MLKKLELKKQPTRSNPRRWKPRPDTEQITGRVKCWRIRPTRTTGRAHGYSQSTAANAPPTSDTTSRADGNPHTDTTTEQERRPLHTRTPATRSSGQRSSNGAADTTACNAGSTTATNHTHRHQPTSSRNGGDVIPRRPPAAPMVTEPTTEQHHEPADHQPTSSRNGAGTEQPAPMESTAATSYRGDNQPRRWKPHRPRRPATIKTRFVIHISYMYKCL